MFYVLTFRIGSLLGGLTGFKKLTGSTDDDWADRMNHLWTVLLLAVFAILVSTGQYVGDPIHCWCPAEFPGHFVDYAKSICWISNTYYVPMQDTIPVSIPTREDKEITYYQWVPLIFLFQAFMFKFPNIVWRLFNSGSGINLPKIVEMAENTQMASPEERETTIKHIALYMDRWLETRREYKYNMYVRTKQVFARFCCLFCGKREGTFLTGFYLFVKLIYCANVIGQFFILNGFMAMEYSMYGVEAIKFLSENGKWRESPRFPRVTLCDFEIRQLQNIQRFTVQCVLPINLFNEKMFIFLWFWLVFVSTLTVGNLLLWFYRVVLKRNRQIYIKKYLQMSDEISTNFDKQLCRKFADTHLRDDGVFVLRVVAKNSNDMVASDLVYHLWKLFKDRPVFRKNMDDYTDTETKA